MRSIRFASLVFGLLILTFTVRLGDMVVQALLGQRVVIVPSQAMANEEGAKKEEDHKTEAKKEDKKEDEKDKKEREEIPPKSKDKKTEVKGMEPDPFIVAPFSDDEIKVLQSLSKRREELDKRASDLDQREKLLQAAEKKVDEKVFELNELRKNIDDLLNKQQAIQDENIGQLVKIYESCLNHILRIIRW